MCIPINDDGSQTYTDPGGRFLFAYINVQSATRRIKFIREAIFSKNNDKTTFSKDAFDGLNDILEKTEGLLEGARKCMDEIDDRSCIED